MTPDAPTPPLNRRELLRMIGITAGSAAMYQAMCGLGFAAESPYKGPIDLQGAPRGARPARRLSADPGFRYGRHDRGLRAA
jgi:hypothetical protein